MKTKNPFCWHGVVLREAWLLPVLLGMLGLVPPGNLAAQTFTVLHSFTALSGPNLTNSDGAVPFTGLTLSGATLYGTTDEGGSSGNGTVFAMNIDGTGFTNLLSFTGGYINSEGRNPGDVLIQSGNTLYGAALYGGSSGYGTVFAVHTDGSGVTNLHTFSNGSDGGYPHGGLVLSGNILYGTAIQGGSSGYGTVFAVHTDGTGFTILHSFTRGLDGGYPYGGLVLTNNTLYGTSTQGGGPGSGGTVFAVHTDGSGFTTVHSFNPTSDGSVPYAGLILSGNTFYGTAQYGGSSGNGTVFKLNTDGTGFTNLHSFTATTDNKNSDGANPFGGLVLSGNTLYGTAQYGGNLGNGTVFAVNTDGTGFTNLHDFYYANDGMLPYAGLVLLGNTLYGTAESGGSSGKGTVYSLSFLPQLTITASGTNVVLSWPTNVAGFDYTVYTLQSTTDLNPPVVWSTNSPAPVVIGGQLMVTNPITGTQRFYRLVQ